MRKAHLPRLRTVTRGRIPLAISFNKKADHGNSIAKDVVDMSIGCALPSPPAPLFQLESDRILDDVCALVVMTTSADAAAILSFRNGAASVLAGRNVAATILRIPPDVRDDGAGYAEIPANIGYLTLFRTPAGAGKDPVLVRHHFLRSHGRILGALAVPAQEPRGPLAALEIQVQRKLADLAQSHLHRTLVLRQCIEQQFRLIEDSLTDGDPSPRAAGGAGDFEPV